MSALYDYERAMELLKILLASNIIIIEYLDGVWQLNSNFGGVGEGKTIFEAAKNLANNKHTLTTETQLKRIIAVLSQKEEVDG